MEQKDAKPQIEQKELNDAKSAFRAEVNRIKKEKQQLNIELEKAKQYMEKKNPVYDPDTEVDLKDTIQYIEEEKKEIPEIPENLTDIQNMTKEVLKKINYTEEIEDIRNKKYLLKESAQKYIQIHAPSSSFVKEKLKKNTLIKEITSITKKTDPYGNLNKEHQYIGMVFFSSKFVNQKKVVINEWKSTGNKIIDRGVDGGGSVEIFATEKDAKKRNEYLKKFDGTLLSGGRHKQLGTLVIRTSRFLSETKQNQLEESIQDSLLEVDK